MNEFRSKGSEFLFRVFNDSKVLEQVTGLDELQKAVDDNDDWDVEDEGDDDF